MLVILCYINIYIVIYNVILITKLFADYTVKSVPSLCKQKF